MGAFLVSQFAGLGAWQISRGLEKGAARYAYQDETGFKTWQDGMEVRSFQRLKVTGSYDGEHQIVLDNIIINSRYGHYVLTPLEIASDQPLLLVNRGWVEKTGREFDTKQHELPASEFTVQGRRGLVTSPG